MVGFGPLTVLPLGDRILNRIEVMSVVRGVDHYPWNTERLCFVPIRHSHLSIVELSIEINAAIKNDETSYHSWNSWWDGSWKGKRYFG